LKGVGRQLTHPPVWARPTLRRLPTPNNLLLWTRIIEQLLTRCCQRTNKKPVRIPLRASSSSPTISRFATTATASLMPTSNWSRRTNPRTRSAPR